MQRVQLQRVWRCKFELTCEPAALVEVDVRGHMKVDIKFDMTVSMHMKVDVQVCTVGRGGGSHC